MFSKTEREIIERCYAVSIWNYRMGKATTSGKILEISVFRTKVLNEIQLLKGLLMKVDYPTPTSEIKPRRISRFFSRLIGRGGLK